MMLSTIEETPPTSFRFSGTTYHPKGNELIRYQQTYSKYHSLSNDELIIEKLRIKEKMKSCSQNMQLNDWNEYVCDFQILSSLIDYGYDRYEKIHRRSEHMWVEDTILQVDHDALVFRSVTVPPEMVRKITDDNNEDARKMVSR